MCGMEQRSVQGWGGSNRYKFFHIYTISHIHRYTGSQEEGAGPGSVLLYKKAPVSWTGHPLLEETQGAQGLIVTD